MLAVNTLEQTVPDVHILIVDDDPNVVGALKRELRQLSCVVHAATSGKEAVQLMDKQEMAVLVTDHKMPGMSGVDLLRYARQYFPKMSTLMLSGEGDLSAAVELLNQGLTNKYLTKPWDKDALRNEIELGIQQYCKRQDSVIVKTSISEEINETPEVENATAHPAMIVALLNNRDDIRLSYGVEILAGLDRVVVKAMSQFIAQNKVIKSDEPGVYAIYLNEEKPEKIEGLCSNLRQHLQRTFTVNGQTVFCHLGVGFRMLRECKIDHNILISSLITTISRDANRVSVSHLDDSTIERYQRQEKLRAEVQYGLQNNQFKLAFQPKVTLKTGMIESVEVLLRWQHHSLGWVPPSEFVRLAELDGQIEAIGDWVLENGVRASAELLRFSSELRSVAINISAKQLHGPRVIGFIASLLEKYGIEPHFLELEITETAVAENNNYLEELLWQLKLLGVRIAIDDFGAGYTSFSYLSKLPIDVLKLDKSLIDNIEHDFHRQAFVKSLIDTCDKLEIQVVAEGVEQQDTLETMVQLGCQKVQGFIFSKAVPRQELEKLLIRQPFRVKR